MEEVTGSNSDVNENIEISGDGDETSHLDAAKRLKTEDKTENDLGIASTSNGRNSYTTDVVNNLENNSRNNDNNVENLKRVNVSDCDSGDVLSSLDEDTSMSNNSSDFDPLEDSPRYGSALSDLSSNSFNYSPTVINDSETENEEEHPVLKKDKPKHKWFLVPEVINRQAGYKSNQKSSELFQRRCYGSLHCVQRLELMYKLEEHRGCVNSLNFHPDGTLLASGSDDLKVIIWDWKNGKSLLSFETKHRGNVFQSKFLPLAGDLHIVTCSRDGQVRLAQVSALEGLRSSRKLGVHKGPCHRISVLSEQPQVVFSTGEDGLVLSHDVRCSKSEKIVSVTDNDRPIPLYSISSHPLNSHEFCIAGRDYAVRVYDQRKCSDSNPLQKYHPFSQKSRSLKNYHVTCAVYNHNGSEILASYNDDDIYLFDVKSQLGKYVHQYQGHRNGATIKGVNFFGPKSEYVVSGSDCGYVFFWDRNTEAIVQWLLADDNGVVNVLEPHPSFPFLCTSGLDWDIKVWVPSYEQEPAMTGLAEAVKSNLKSRINFPVDDFDDSQMLWVLWRQLSGTRNLRRAFNFALDVTYSYPPRSSSPGNNSSSSSSDSSSNTQSDSEQEDFDTPPGCTTS